MGDYRGSIGKLYVKPIVDLKTAMEALDKCMESIIDNPNNLSFIRNLDKDYIRSFVKDVVLNNNQYDYRIIGFYSQSADELVGCCLLSYGYPWYSDKQRILNEEWTVSFKRGAGIARALSDYLIDCLKNDECDYIQTGSVNDWCAPMLKNSYVSKGFRIYNCYYLSKEDINGLNQESL